jgi:hypothetical protein
MPISKYIGKSIDGFTDLWNQQLARTEIMASFDAILIAYIYCNFAVS